jgi:Tfp pilus assembly protein PilN
VRPVNLLPDARHDAGARAERKARKTRIAVVVAVGLLLLVALVVGAELIQSRSDVSDKKDALAALKRDLAAALSEAATPSAAETELQARLTALTAAQSSRVHWDVLLADLAAVMPRGAWLTSLKAQSPTSPGATVAVAGDATAATAAAPTTPTAFVMSGYALSQGTVANAMDRLALIPALSEISLQQTSRSEVAGRSVIQFGIASNVRTGVAP